MGSTKNHRPLINYKKISKLEELSEKFDLSADEEISPLRVGKSNNITGAEAEKLIQKLIESGVEKDNFPNPNIIGPSGENSGGTKNMFYQRKYYKEYVFPDGAHDFSSGGCEAEYGNYRGVSKNIFAPPKSIDMLYERTFYGKVDDCGVVVYPSEIFLKPISLWVSDVELPRKSGILISLWSFVTFELPRKSGILISLWSFVTS